MTSPAPRVIVPAYNYGRYLGNALRSILGQSRTALEVHVVDDGSTDETPEVLAQFTDPRVTTHRTERLGVSRVRAMGASLAHPPLVAWLNADDVWRPGYLERQVAVLDAEPDVGFVFTDFARTENGESLPKTEFEHCPELAAIATRPSRAGGARVIEGNAFAALESRARMHGWIQATVHRKSVHNFLRLTPGGTDAEGLRFQVQALRARAGRVQRRAAARGATSRREQRHQRRPGPGRCAGRRAGDGA